MSATDTERRLRALEDAVARLAAAGRPLIADGTWTPTLLGASTAGSFTYDRQTGVWRRVGDLVYIAARARISGIATPAVGALQMATLPLAPLSTGSLSGFGLGIAFYSLLNLSASVVQVTAQVGASSGIISFAEVYDNAGNTDVNSALLGVGSDIGVAGWYITTE